MVVQEGETVTRLESIFCVPWLSKFAEKGGVGLEHTVSSCQNYPVRHARRGSSTGVEGGGGAVTFPCV